MSGNPAAFTDEVLAHRRASLLLPQHSLRFVPGGPTLVVTFMSALPQQQAPLATAVDEGIWGEGFLAKRGHSILGVGRRRNDWYLDADLQAAMELLAARGVFARFRQVVFYGGSMGGFGALTYARLAPGALVLAHNPQTTLRREDTPWERRYEHGRQFDWSGPYGDAATGLGQVARVYVSYDPHLKDDLRHVQRLPREHLVPLRVPCVGHQMPIWLQQMQLLAPVFDGVVDGSLSSERFREWARARVGLSRYWFTMAQRRRHPARRETLAERARSLAPGDPQPREFLRLLTRARLRPPPEPRRAFWVADMDSARRLVQALSVTHPGVRPLLDPFKDPARGYDLQASAGKAAHGSMVAEEVDRHLGMGPTPVLMPTPGDFAVDVAWGRALQERGYEAVVLAPRQLPAAQALAPALAGAETLGLLLAWLEDGGMPVRRLATDEAAPDDTPPDLMALHAALASSHSPAVADEHPGDRWLRLLRAGPAVPRPALRVELETLVPERVRIDPLPPVVAWGAPLPVSGLVLPASLPPGAQCHLRQGLIGPPLTWPQPSPGGQAQFPGQPGAAQSRFGQRAVRADPTQDVCLELHPQAPDAAPEALAWIRLRTCGARPPLHGLYLAPWSIGFLPQPGSGALALCDRLLGLLPGPRPPWPPSAAARRTQLEGWTTDVSGARWRFSVLADPVERFVRLHRRAMRAGPLRGLPDVRTLDGFIRHFDTCMAQRPAWAEWFEPQATRLQDLAPDALFATERPEALAIWLQTRWGLVLPTEGDAPTTTPSWWRRLTGRARATPEAVSDVARAWILERYAQDLPLWQAAAAPRIIADPRTGT
jgi:hypothetical protein